MKVAYCTPTLSLVMTLILQLNIIQTVYCPLLFSITCVDELCFRLDSLFSFSYISFLMADLMAQEVNASFDGASGGHIHCHGPNLRVTKLHERLDLATWRRAFRSTHVQTKRPTLPDAGLADEAHVLLFGAVDVDDDDLLGRLGRCVAPFYRLTQCHRLVGGDEGVENVSAPSGAVLHQQLLRRVLALHEAVEDAYAVCEGRAADFDDTGIQAKQHGAFKDGEADVMRDDDAAAALEHVLDSMLQQGGLSKTSH